MTVGPLTTARLRFPNFLTPYRGKRALHSHLVWAYSTLLSTKYETTLVPDAVDSTC